MNRYIRHTDPRSEEIDGHSTYRGEAWHFRPWEYRFAVDNLDGSVVLDAGAGVSHPLQFILAGRCELVYAVDLDARMDHPLAPGFRGLVRRACSFCSMPWMADDVLDQVFCISVLEHMQPADRAAALNEFRRVLRPGGSLVLTMDVPRVPVLDLLADAADAGLMPVGDVSLDEHPDDVVFDWRGEVLRVWRGVFR